MTEREPQRGQERQARVERLTAQYVADYEAGLSPSLDEYIARNPDIAQELADFALYFHTVAADLPALDTANPPLPSAAAQRAFARLFGSSIQGLVARGVEVGITAPKLMERIRLSPDLLGKLEARALTTTSIPTTLVARLAESLQAPAAAISSFLGARPASAAFYYADQAPQARQESFADAVRASALPEATKREWLDVIAREIREES
jgi:hypothetical protein